MVKKSLIWLYRAALSALWLTIIVLTVSILALRYFILPNIASYKDRIAVEFSQAVGQKITIGSVQASWSGMNPHLSLRQVAIHDAQGRLSLMLDEIETSLSWLSLPLFEPTLAALAVRGPEISVRREADGTLVVAGMKMGGDSNPELANWALRQSRIDIIDATVRWQDEMRQAPPLTLDRLHLVIVNPVWERLLNRHQFALRATPSAGTSQPIDLRGNLYGADIARPQSWRGTIYGRMDGTDIAAWRRWFDPPFELTEGFGATRFWLDFSHGAATRLTSDVVLQQVRARISKTSPEADLNTLSGRLVWTAHDDGEALQVDRIRLVGASGLTLSNGMVNVRERRIDGRDVTEGSVRLNSVDLAAAHVFSRYLPLPEKGIKQLDALAPVGEVSQLEASWKGTAAALDQYSLRMQFHDLGIQPYGEIPGFSGLSGALNANDRQGTLNINAQQATVDFKNVMRWPIPAEKLSGTVRWTHHAGGIDVRVTNLALSSVHLAGSINATYRHRNDAPASIELNGRFDRADARHALFYYPQMLGHDTLHWLDTSIIGGTASNISVILRGRLDQFPFVNPEQGLFKVTARVKDGVLDYGKDWPKIEQLNLDLLFQGNRMELTADGGRILGNRLRRVKAVIPALDADDPVVEVSGEAEGTVADGVRFINQSPVHAYTDGFTDELQTSGSGRLSLNLRIPLEDVDATRVQGSYRLIDAAMAAPSMPALNAINGQVEFTESSITAKNIAARVYGGPTRIDISSGSGRLVRVTARGNLSDAGLSQALGHDVGDLAHGNADWFGDIRILPQQLDFTLRSNLAGMALHLPYPIGKDAESRMPLRIDKRQQSPQQDLISVSMANQVAAKMLRTSAGGTGRIERGEIGINLLPELPAEPGISVRGSFGQLDLDQWLDVWEKIRPSLRSGAEAPPVRHVGMSIDTLDVFERRLNALKLSADKTGDGWRMQINSREMNGEARWIDQDNGKIIARLSNLTVPAKTPSSPGLTADDRTMDDATPAKTLEYPDLDITADTFVLGQKNLGQLDLAASEKNDVWFIDQLKISNPDSVLTARGEWHNWRHHPHTRMDVLWEIGKLDETLARYGHPDLIKSGSARLEGKLRWPGSPHEFNIEQLSGEFRLDAKSGQVLKVKPGVGRLFGVLTLQNLPRRLTLDFRDVLSSGFAFDRVTSNARIDQGIMRSDDFLVEGPAAKIEIRGETDLKRETQNLKVKVTPHISDSLSLAALAGGPAVAAATFVAQKLLKDPLNKFAAEEYEITGSWDDPIENKPKKAAEEPIRSIPGQ